MLPVFYTVGGAILYCLTVRYTTAGAVAARFYYGWLCYPLLGNPPYTTVGTDTARFYAASCAILHCATLTTQHLGLMLNVLFRCLGFLCNTSLCYPPLRWSKGKCCIFWCDGWAPCARLHCATPVPYTALTGYAAYFGAMGGLLVQPFTALPPLQST